MATLLLIDDNVDFRESLATRIRRDFGPRIHLIETDSGDEATQLALLHQPDLIISDIAHSGANGLEVFAWLRRNPLTTPIPFIFLTASENRYPHVLASSEYRPPEGYFNKPLLIDEFIRAIMPYLSY